MSKPTHLTQEADIGSGERGPAQQETDKMIEQVPPNQPTTSADTRDHARSSDQGDGNAQSGNPP